MKKASLSYFLPFKGRNEKGLLPIVFDLQFMTIWGLQSRSSTILLLTLAVFVGVWQAVLIMLPWGLVATHFYEKARSNGLEDVMVAPAKKAGCQKIKTFAWFVYGLKIYLFGYQQFLYAWAFDRQIKPEERGWLSRQVRKAAIVGAMSLFGVTATHHTLKVAGLSREQIYWGNMAGRFVQVPVKLLETTVVVGLVFLVIRMIPFSDLIN